MELFHHENFWTLTGETHTYTYIFINPRSHVTIQDAKTVSGEIEKEAKKKTKLNYLQQINIYITLQYCLMDGKAFAWKSVTDSASTAELGRPFQRGIRSGKKENLYPLVRAKICLNL